MSTLNSFKLAVAASVLAFTATSSLAIDRDEHGFLAKPSCNSDRIMKMSLDNQKSTGKKASNSAWDMELYADEKTGEWSLLGIAKNAKGPKPETCLLAAGVKNSYAEKNWYAAYFTAPGADKPRIASVPQDPKPNLN